MAYQGQAKHSLYINAVKSCYTST
ncbi:MAG: hypothetical protein Q9M40_08565 [Sulfurimonas sp.]|nr:hypothetical protein [Sulfurimonas sp.]